MNELTMSLHMPGIKLQSKQCANKGLMGPVKANIHLSKKNRLALVFYDSLGVICTNLITKETMVNVTYFRTALGRLVSLFEKKMPNVAAGGRFFFWDNAHVNTAAIVQNVSRQ
jgi:uncharacterized membrane protein YobD (UPF0266 family)